MRKKQLDVAEFSIYWDVDCTLLGDLPQMELQVRFRQGDLLQDSMEGKRRRVTAMGAFVSCISDSRSHPLFL